MRDKICDSVLLVLLSIASASFIKPMYDAGKLAEFEGQNYAPFVIIVGMCLMTSLLSIVKVCHIWDGRVGTIN